jgi:hypothetical protein
MSRRSRRSRFVKPVERGSSSCLRPRRRLRVRRRHPRLAHRQRRRPVGRRRAVTDAAVPSLLSEAALDARKRAEEARASRPQRRAA